MSLCPEFGGESASPQDVCVGKGGMAFSICEGGSKFPTASVNVNSPHDLECVASRPVWGF